MQLSVRGRRDYSCSFRSGAGAFSCLRSKASSASCRENAKERNHERDDGLESANDRSFGCVVPHFRSFAFSRSSTAGCRSIGRSQRFSAPAVFAAKNYLVLSRVPEPFSGPQPSEGEGQNQIVPAPWHRAGDRRISTCAWRPCPRPVHVLFSPLVRVLFGPHLAPVRVLFRGQFWARGRKGAKASRTAPGTRGRGPSSPAIVAAGRETGGQKRTQACDKAGCAAAGSV
jgi:hypothetical protein